MANENEKIKEHLKKLYKTRYVSSINDKLITFIDNNLNMFFNEDNHYVHDGTIKITDGVCISTNFTQEKDNKLNMSHPTIIKLSNSLAYIAGSYGVIHGFVLTLGNDKLEEINDIDPKDNIPKRLIVFFQKKVDDCTLFGLEKTVKPWINDPLTNEKRQEEIGEWPKLFFNQKLVGNSILLKEKLINVLKLKKKEEISFYCEDKDTLEKLGIDPLQQDQNSPEQPEQKQSEQEQPEAGQPEAVQLEADQPSQEQPEAEQPKKLKDYDHQTILFGPPGTGKTFSITEDCKDSGITEKEGNLIRTVFHPEYTYGDFMGRLMPKTDSEGRVQYKYYPGHFMKALARALTTKDDVVLLIDELNRGNAAAIFGSIFNLLDRNEKGESCYSINLSDMEYDELSKLVKNIVLKKEDIQIPANMYIIATINTSDESIYYMDAAFKRRWEWVFVDQDGKKQPEQSGDGGTVIWNDFRKDLNSFILDHSNKIRNIEDKLIGPWFIGAHDSKVSVSNKFANKVMFHLWDSVFARDKSPLEDKISGNGNKVKLRTYGDFINQYKSFFSKFKGYI